MIFRKKNCFLFWERLGKGFGTRRGRREFYLFHQSRHGTVAFLDLDMDKKSREDEVNLFDIIARINIM